MIAPVLVTWLSASRSGTATVWAWTPMTTACGGREPGRRCSRSCAPREHVAEETQDMKGIGRFGWVTDPEGNRVELWQLA